MQKGKLAFLFISDCERFPEWLSHKKNRHLYKYNLIEV